MLRKALIAGFMAVALASCGQAPNPCPPVQISPAPGQSSMIDDGLPVVQARFSAGRSGGFSGRSFSSGRSSSFSSGRTTKSGSWFSKPTYKPAPKPVTTPIYRTAPAGNTTIIQNGGGSNGFLWGLGGYLLGSHMAQDRCK